MPNAESNTADLRPALFSTQHSEFSIRFLQCSEQDSNLQQRESRSRASAGIGLPEHQWTPEGIEPSFTGCKPGVFPLDDGPMFHSRCGKDSNLLPRPSEGRALIRLSYRNLCHLSFVIGHLLFAV